MQWRPEVAGLRLRAQSQSLLRTVSLHWRSRLGFVAALGTALRLVAAPLTPPVTQDWVTRVTGPTPSYFEAAGFTLGPTGDVFVAGYILAGLEHDIVVSRHSGAGTMVWRKRYQPEDGLSVEEFSMAIAAGGPAVYVAGTTVSTNGGQDFLTLKYHDNGELEWAARFDGTGHSTDRPTAVAVDDQGNVLVSGDSIGADGSLDLLVVKYGPAGNLQE